MLVATSISSEQKVTAFVAQIVCSMNFVKSIANADESSFRRPKLMQHGDLVIVYERHDALDHFYLKTGDIFNNRFGSFHHNDIIGKPFGSKVQSRREQGGYIYILEPTPELWSIALHTRTQIVNELDSAFVTTMLDVFPGCYVVESGTGSGCMTLSLARAVHPSGLVYTFEFNGVRAEKAKEEFDRLGVGHLIKVTCKDVCGKFESQEVEPSTGSKDSNRSCEVGGFSGVPDGAADAVFLDLPEPWLALEHVLRVLKPGRSVCCYSPCMEQVMKTCEKLRDLKFHSIRMMEVRQRPYDARIINFDTLDLGLSAQEQYLNNQAARDPQNQFQSFLNRSDQSYGIQQLDDVKVEHGDAPDCDPEKDERSAKRQRVYEGEASTASNPPPQQVKSAASIRSMNNRIRNRPKSSVNGSYQMQIARPITIMKGHTAFLTFAVCPLSKS